MYVGIFLEKKYNPRFLGKTTLCWSKTREAIDSYASTMGN